MSYRTVHIQEKHPGRVWLQLLLLLGFLLSLLVGAGALAGIILLDRGGPPVVDQTALVDPSRIPPHLALLQLTGADGDALVRQATDAGERALGLSIVLLDGGLSDRARATEGIRLGRLFLEAEDPLRAAAALRTARTVAIFAPTLPPLERGELLARSAAGLWAADEPRAAVETALQAQYVAVQSPDLLPAQRAQILQAIAPLLREHATPAEARQIDELLRSPGRTSQRVPLISRWAALQQPFPMELALSEAVALRREAAQRLADRIVATGGVDIEPEREALHQALLHEDRTRADAYTRPRAVDLDLTQQHALIQAQRVWLITKLRIAQGGYGIRLVPEWEKQTDRVRTALARTTEDLVPVLEAQINAHEDPTVRAMLRVETLHWLAYQHELGFYPNAPLGELADQIEQAQAELERLNVPLALPLFYAAGAETPGFRIARRYE